MENKGQKQFLNGFELKSEGMTRAEFNERFTLILPAIVEQKAELAVVKDGYDDILYSEDDENMGPIGFKVYTGDPLVKIYESQTSNIDCIFSEIVVVFNITD